MSDNIKLLIQAIGGYGAGYVMTADNMEDEFEIVGAIDPFAKDSPAFDEFEDKAVFDSLDEFYAAGYSTDAIVISSPIQHHAKHFCDALEKGLHVLCEKPLCATDDEALKMLESAEKHSELVSLIGFQWSFSPAILKAKQQIIDGVWGAPISLKAIVRWPRGYAYYARNDWAGKLKDSAGNFVGDSVLSNATAHYLHNPLFILGDYLSESAKPQKIQAETYKAFDIETFDTAFVSLDVPNKHSESTKVFVTVSHSCEGTDDPIIEYNFENGHMWRTKDDRLVGNLKGKEVDFGPIGSNLEGYYNKLKHLYDCINKSEQAVCTAKTAYPTFKTTDYILNAIKTKSFKPELIEEVAMGSNDMRLMVKGLDFAMQESFEKMLMPSELGIELGD